MASFLGAVNLFHRRIEDGRVFIGDTRLEIASANSHARDVRAMLYVRPFYSKSL